MRILPITISILYGIGIVSAAEAKPLQEYTEYLPTGTSLSIMAQEVGATSPFLAYNNQLLTLPASTQKIPTALAALLELGPNFKFTTTFETSGKLAKGRLNGSLIVRFSGDPTFSRQHLKMMINELKRKNITVISGDLLVDTTIFASHDKAPGWSWNNITHCYNAPAAAAIIDRNCFTISLQSAKEKGQLATVTLPSQYPITITSQVRSYPKNASEWKYCELDVTAINNNYTLTGCLLQQKKPAYLSFAIQDADNYAQAVIQQELKNAGIKLLGRAKPFTGSGKTTLLAKHQSVPLSALLTTMLKESDNMIADNLYRTLGNKRFGVPGTWRSGGDAVRVILKQKAHIELNNSVIADGSGLSRKNLISAESMIKILQYIADNNQQLKLIEMLPVSGVDGTLKNRRSMKEEQFQGVIKAKTGALDGVYNLAGFLTTEKGKQIAFVQFITNYVAEPTRNSKASLSEFEIQLYQALYHEQLTP